MLEHLSPSPWLLWFGAGIILAILELALPGFILIFFALGCLVTACVFLFFEPTLTQQLMIFLIASIGSLFLLRHWLSQTFRGSLSDQDKGDYDDTPQGQKATVVSTVGPQKTGRIRYRGTDWCAMADESLEAGTVVEILGYADNSRQTFRVAKLKE